MTDIASQLAEPFPKELLRQNKHKGNITYVAGSEVIARLNRVLGWNGWSYEVVRMWEAGAKETETGVYPVWCMAHVRLTVAVQFPDDLIGTPRQYAVKDGVGGQQVKFLNNGTGPNDLGDEYKGAVTDALKKAAQSLGIALDLARGEEAMRWEADLSDDMACPMCQAVVAGAKSDREPMRAHLVEMHDYLRNEDGTVQKPSQGTSTTSPPVEADTSTSAANPAGEGQSLPESVASKKALGAVKKGAA